MTVPGSHRAVCWRLGCLDENTQPHRAEAAATDAPDIPSLLAAWRQRFVQEGRSPLPRGRPAWTAGSESSRRITSEATSYAWKESPVIMAVSGSSTSATILKDTAVFQNKKRSDCAFLGRVGPCAVASDAWIGFIQPHRAEAATTDAPDIS